MESHLNTFKYRTTALYKFLTINFVLSLVIGLQYVFSTSGIDGLWSTVFVYSALISNTLMIYLALFIIFLPFLFIKSVKQHYLIFVPLTILLQLHGVDQITVIGGPPFIDCLLFKWPSFLTLPIDIDFDITVIVDIYELFDIIVIGLNGERLGKWP